MKETVFHFCAMAQLSGGRAAYSDGCVRVPEGGSLDLDRLRADAANAIAGSAGSGVVDAGKLNVTLLSVTRLN